MEQVLIISSFLLWVLTLFNLILTLALVRQSKTPPPAEKNGLAQGEQAPDFSAETLDGRQVTLSDYAGRSAVFIFIAADCGPCRENLSSYEALYPKAPLAGVELALVSVSSEEITRRLVDEYRLKCPVLIAPISANPFMADYKMNGTPSYTLIDAKGKVQATGRPLSMD